MISRSIFIAEPSGRLEELKEKIKEILEKEEESCCGFSDDEECDCDCKFDIEEDLEDYDEDEDLLEDDFEEEEDSFKKNILIKRDQIQEDEYEFNFFDEETEEFVWSFYSCDSNYNEAKEAFIEEFDHLDVTFYLAE